MKTATAFRAAMATDTGRQRPNNEDRVYIDETRGVFLVIDGVGGHAAGEKAAEIALETIPKELESLGGSTEARVRGAITAANNEILEAAGHDAEL
ncbi:MAG TPA: protein phosphatase 2C domain-containing protein, partial [Chloroflexota bacterium]|nr:protein phosphatase 2C domain-containing protein [Chloroflexota bacterium]